MRLIPLSHAHENGVDPGLTRSRTPLNRVQLCQRAWCVRCESGLRGEKAGYERIVDRDSFSLQLPAISFQNERILYLTQTVLR